MVNWNWKSWSVEAWKRLPTFATWAPHLLRTALPLWPKVNRCSIAQMMADRISSTWKKLNGLPGHRDHEDLYWRFKEIFEIQPWGLGQICYSGVMSSGYQRANIDLESSPIEFGFEVKIWISLIQGVPFAERGIFFVEFGALETRTRWYPWRKLSIIPSYWISAFKTYVGIKPVALRIMSIRKDLTC